MPKRKGQYYKKQHQGGGCMGCVTGVLFGLLFCVGLLLFFGKAQAVADGLVALYQGERALTVQWQGETYLLSLQPELAPEQVAQPTATPTARNAQQVRTALEESSTLFSDGITRYAYTTLTDAQKITYLLVAQCAFDMAQEVELPSQASTDLSTIWPLVQMDFPELFWVDTVLARTITQGEAVQVFFVPTYTLTAVQRAAQEASVQQVAALYLQSLPADATDYQKAKAAYEFVVGQVTYLETENDQTLYGALGQGQAVCAGYARAVQYLLNQAGVVCGYVSGQAIAEYGTVTHAWNFVLIEGEYYYLDATWGESSFDDGVDYAYLCVNAADLATTHFANDTYPLPTVNGTAYNYYRAEGLYIEAYSMDAVQSAMALQVGAEGYSLRFSSAEAFQAARSNLIEAQEVYRIFRSIGAPTDSIGYTYKEALYILTIYPNAS